MEQHLAKGGSLDDQAQAESRRASRPRDHQERGGPHRPDAVCSSNWCRWAVQTDSTRLITILVQGPGRCAARGRGSPWITTISPITDRIRRKIRQLELIEAAEMGAPGQTFSPAAEAEVRRERFAARQYDRALRQQSRQRQQPRLAQSPGAPGRRRLPARAAPGLRRQGEHPLSAISSCRCSRRWAWRPIASAPNSATSVAGGWCRVRWRRGKFPGKPFAKTRAAGAKSFEIQTPCGLMSRFPLAEMRTASFLINGLAASGRPRRMQDFIQSRLDADV